MYYTGIDPSLNSPAIVIIDNNYNLIDYMVIGTIKKFIEYGNYKIIPVNNKDENFKIKRLQFLIDTIFEFINKYNITDIAIEGYSYGSQSRSMYEIGEFVGALKYNLYNNNINVVVIEPTVMKKIITGKGNAKKDKVQESLLFHHKYLKDEFNKYGNYKNDLFDAFGIAKTYKLISKHL
jgi:Holliday junction resolvasome RuvABC endonuclease subunit